MIKIQIGLFLVFISVYDLAGKCLEESSANEGTSELLEKSELFAADTLSSDSKADEVDANEKVSKSSEVEQREDSNNKELDSVDEKADESSDLVDKETSLEEKSTIDKIVSEREAETLESPNSESKTVESLDEISEKSGKNSEQQAEELPDISKSATEIEEKKGEDLSEASAESKVSDNEMSSSPIHESDRTESKREELKETPDELGLDDIIATRRMLSQPNAVLDIKARKNEGLSVVVPEDRNAFNPNINANNNYEFDPGNSNINDRAHILYQGDKSRPLQTNTDQHILLTPETKVKTQTENIYVPQLYPQSKLHLDFPVFDVQQQEPRSVPIYSELEHDQGKMKNNVIGTQSAKRCNAHCIPTKRQFHQSQINMDATRPLINQFRNIEYEDQQFQNSNTQNLFPRNLNQQFQGRGIKDARTPLANNNFENLSIESTAQIPLFLQNGLRSAIFPMNFRTSSENTHPENLGHASRNQVQLVQNPRPITFKTKQSDNFNHEQRNEFQFHQAQRTIDPYMPSDNKAVENLSHEKYGYPYPNMQLFQNPVSNILKAPHRNFDISSENYKTIFQTLAAATGNPKKQARANIEIKQTYPNFYNPNDGGSPSFDLNVLSGFKFVK